MKATYTRAETLKSKKQIDKLFDEGQYISTFPLRIIYMPNTSEDAITIKTTVSVSRRNFKKAVDRNRIKRLLRESYRLNKGQYFNNITTQWVMMILYIGNEMPSFKSIDGAMKELLKKCANALLEKKKL